jgi:hypothetical protein
LIEHQSRFGSIKCNVAMRTVKLTMHQCSMLTGVRYDTYETMKDSINSVQLDLLASELGGIGGKYVCKQTVEVTGKLNFRKRNKKVTAMVKEGDTIVAIKQGFNKRGDARLLTATGWVSFSSGGLLGQRNFDLLEAPKAEKTGSLHFKIERYGTRLIATVIHARGLANKDFLGKNDVYTVVEVNGVRKQTATLDNAGANAAWGGEGEAIEFKVGVGALDAIVLECWDEDETNEDDLIGVCVFPVAAFDAAGDTWGPWEGSRVLREKQVQYDVFAKETGNPLAIYDSDSGAPSFETGDDNMVIADTPDADT